MAQVQRHAHGANHRELFDLSRVASAAAFPIERGSGRSGDAGPQDRRRVRGHQSEAKDQSSWWKGNVCGEWDGGRLGQVLSNLVGNAVRHGNVTIPITVRLAGDDDAVEVCVHNGGHISEDLIPRLFQPFQSGARPPKHAEGSGSGLAYIGASKIVIAHGLVARCEVCARPPADSGAAFRIRLERARLRPARFPFAAPADENGLRCPPKCVLKSTPR